MSKFQPLRQTLFCRKRLPLAKIMWKNAGLDGLEAGGGFDYPVRYVGISGPGRATAYAIEAAEFNGTASDWLYDFAVNVNGRVPFDIGEHTIWIGAEAGFRFTDFMVFKGCLEVDCNVFFEPLALPGLGLGAELGADIGDDVFAIVGSPSHWRTSRCLTSLHSTRRSDIRLWITCLPMWASSPNARAIATGSGQWS